MSTLNNHPLLRVLIPPLRLLTIVHENTYITEDIIVIHLCFHFSLVLFTLYYLSKPRDEEGAAQNYLSLAKATNELKSDFLLKSARQFRSC
jgi:hypothetical protein